MKQTLVTDVLVVGLGPAGAAAARAAANAGCRVIAVDRKRTAGIPVQCAEFVPAMLSPSIEAVRNSQCQRIRGMQTFIEHAAPDCKEPFPGVMVDRAKFDQRLVAAAQAAGAACRFGLSVAQAASDGTVTLGNGEQIKATWIIGADGPRSRIGRAINSKNRHLVAARQISVNLIGSHHATDIFLSAAYRGGYAWLFPRGKVANLGVGVDASKRAHLKPLLDDLHARLVRERRVASDILSTTGGAIPVGGMIAPHGKLGACTVLLCGDAAGLTNPVTGAGISSAVLSGRLAGEYAAQGLSGDSSSALDYAEELDELFRAALDRAVRRRQTLLASYRETGTPNRTDLRAAWIAYPEYWAAQPAGNTHRT